MYFMLMYSTSSSLAGVKVVLCNMLKKKTIRPQYAALSILHVCAIKPTDCSMLLSTLALNGAVIL